MASAIEDVSSLPGETINDQDGRKIGKVKEIYAVGDDETPMWVTVEASSGLGRNRLLFVPLARIKKEGDEIRVPYSFQHVESAPEVDGGEDLSEEDDRALRDYYSIGLADQEFRENAQSYASQVPDEEEPARRVDASSVEGPVREIDDTAPAERAAEADEADREHGDDDRKGRKATAADILDEDGGEGDGKSEENSESKDAGEGRQPRGDAGGHGGDDEENQREEE